MTHELLGRVHRELLDVLKSINEDRIHHDGDDFHELLNDVEKALAQTQEPVAFDCCANCLRPKHEHKGDNCPKPYTCTWNAWDYPFAPDTTPPQRTEQEPFAWAEFDGEGSYFLRLYENNETYAEDWNKRNPNHIGWVEPIYKYPPQRTWVRLTDETISEIAINNPPMVHEFARAIEAKLKEKNNG